MASQNIQVVDSVNNRPPVNFERNGSVRTVQDALVAAGVNLGSTNKVFVAGAEARASDQLPMATDATLRIVIVPGAPKNA
jgi:hypothetical protein